tara:strand:+ start:44117 stop:44806 length:690 start_codon:yes stop_codon:yes gene_type:complete
VFELINLRKIRTAIHLPVILLMCGCAETTYTNMNQKESAAPILERRVAYKMEPAFFHDPPTCTTIVAKRNNVPGIIRRAVEESLERHLATKFQKAIGGAPARRIAKRLAVDLHHAGDRKVFARQTKCTGFMEVIFDAVEDDYMVLWTNRAVGISLRLVRATDGKILWQSKHKAARGDGGLPFSPISLPVSIARAARIKGDPEVFHSIADDAVRRMMRTLPDTRRDPAFH